MSRRPLTSVIIVIALLLLAFVTNPSPERHREKIKAEVANRSPIAGMLGMGSLEAFASSYHSIGIASYTKGREHVLSYGAFGIVFVNTPS